MGHSFARNQSLSVEPPFDRMEHEESLSADVRRNRYIFENRDPLPGGFVFGGRVVISGGPAFFAHPRPTINRARDAPLEADSPRRPHAPPRRPRGRPR